jgi:hypothetical protein
MRRTAISLGERVPDDSRRYRRRKEEKMSHAALIVAPMKETVEKLGIEGAVSWEMEPFDENKGEMFADGSRWDWYVVGGRFDGILGGENVIQVKLLTLDAIRDRRVQWAEEAYREYVKYFEEHGKVHPFTDVQEGEDLTTYIARRVKGNGVHAYAFLRNRHWHEPERMGWFAMPAYTECERKDLEKVRANPEAWFGKCLHRDEATGAQVVCWNEPTEIWADHYFHRFIEPLHPDDTLVVVDYHV